MSAAVLRISGFRGSAEAVRDKLHGSAIERGDVVVASRLEPEASVNEHLVWLWGMLKHERRFLKRLQADGATLRCICSVQRGTLRLQPNGAEMLHLLGAELIIEAR